MAELQLISRKKRKKKRRHQIESDEKSDAAMHSAGLALLQQTVGNRAVQRILVEDPQRAAPVARYTDGEEENINAMTSLSDEIVEEEAERELCSVELLDRFQVSNELKDLDSDFRTKVQNFTELLEQAGASVEILATTWPPELAYLMHWAWRIAKEDYHPLAVPPIDEIEFNADVRPEIDISWWYGSFEASKTVAEEIVEACGLDDLEEPPALISHHVAGQAIDMKISWNGELFLPHPLGGEVVISSSPHDETNQELIDLAAIYGLVHYEDVDEDPVHWSVDGA